MNDLTLHTAQQAQLSQSHIDNTDLHAKADRVNKFKDILNDESGKTAASYEGKHIARQAAEAEAKAEMAKYAGNDDIDPALRKAASEFEAVFMAEMLKPVFEGMDINPMFGGGHGEKMYRGLLVQEYGKSMADNGGIGLQDYIIDQIQSYQKGAQ